MAKDYALLAKLQELDEGIEAAEYWMDRYRKDIDPDLRQVAMRRYWESRQHALAHMEMVANHGRDD